MEQQLTLTSHPPLENSAAERATVHDEAWTRDDLLNQLEAVKERLEDERREQFLRFGIPLDCYWPASRVYHQHSNMGPATKFRLTHAQVDAFTRDLDYKRYPNSVRTELTHPGALSAGLEDVIRRRQSERTYSARPISFDALSKLLELGCGVTQDQEIPRRAAPSPGGLYAVETYPLVFSVENLAPGIYHYAALDHHLELVQALPGMEVMQPFLPTDLFAARPAVVLALSVVFPRVQTKYLERGYRFALLEAGHIAQNLLLAATALGMNSAPVGGFWDEPFNQLMGFDTVNEAVIYSVFLGHRD